MVFLRSSRILGDSNMTSEHMVRCLEQLLQEIKKYHESKPDYYHTMMSHLYDMCIVSWLELTQNRGLKGGDTIILLDLLRITKIAGRRMVE